MLGLGPCLGISLSLKKNILPCLGWFKALLILHRVASEWKVSSDEHMPAFWFHISFGNFVHYSLAGRLCPWPRRGSDKGQRNIHPACIFYRQIHITQKVSTEGHTILWPLALPSGSEISDLPASLNQSFFFFYKDYIFIVIFWLKKMKSLRGEIIQLAQVRAKKNLESQKPQVMKGKSKCWAWAAFHICPGSF